MHMDHIKVGVLKQPWLVWHLAISRAAPLALDSLYGGRGSTEKRSICIHSQMTFFFLVLSHCHMVFKVLSRQEPPCTSSLSSQEMNHRKWPHKPKCLLVAHVIVISHHGYVGRWVCPCHTDHSHSPLSTTCFSFVLLPLCHQSNQHNLWAAGSPCTLRPFLLWELRKGLKECIRRSSKQGGNQKIST